MIELLRISSNDSMTKEMFVEDMIILLPNIQVKRDNVSQHPLFLVYIH